jgi:hypothetical protein
VHAQCAMCMLTATKYMISAAQCMLSACSNFSVVNEGIFSAAKSIRTYRNIGESVGM